MSDGITDGEREKRKNFERWRRSAIEQLLSTFDVDALINELCKRKGVRSYTTEPNVKYSVEDETGQYEVGDGSVRILVIKDVE